MKRILMLVVVMSVFALLIAGQAITASSQDNAPLSGKVVETMDSGGYTYALIEKNKQKTWVAVPQAKITKGQSVSFQPGMELENFESKTLKRKFEKIVFSGGLLK